MTNDERLRIAEELAEWALSTHDVNLGDIAIQEMTDKSWRAYGERPGVKLAEHSDPIECIYLARQKLAAERDAKKSEREKRLEEVLDRLLQRIEAGCVWNTNSSLVVEAREALKEST